MSNRVNGGLRTRPIERFGWVPDLPDARDFMFSAPEAVLTKMPTKVDLHGHIGLEGRLRHPCWRGLRER